MDVFSLECLLRFRQQVKTHRDVSLEASFNHHSCFITATSTAAAEIFMIYLAGDAPNDDCSKKTEICLCIFILHTQERKKHNNDVHFLNHVPPPFPHLPHDFQHSLRMLMKH